MNQQVFLSLLLGFLLGTSSATAQTGNASLQELTAKPSYTPKGGIVPDAATAIRIAEAVWLPIYGKRVLDEKPFQARLINKEVWVVEGTLAKGLEGGVAYIEISRRDGRVLEVTHGK
ncbi:YbbC/YhhH family protein [uncultured Hymenobacter sp.]|uniref:YbbC/YhhH family protein n=1 Tax=uncultured Hymenobacter sp. TaxID=170016 RepID=UPI0035C9A559